MYAYRKILERSSDIHISWARYLFLEQNPVKVI